MRIVINISDRVQSPKEFQRLFREAVSLCRSSMVSILRDKNGLISGSTVQDKAGRVMVYCSVDPDPGGTRSHQEVIKAVRADKKKMETKHR